MNKTDSEQDIVKDVLSTDSNFDENISLTTSTTNLENSDLIKSGSKNEVERIFDVIESSFPEQKSIRRYSLPQALQWLGTRFFAIWVLPILLINKIRRFFRNKTIVQPYSEKTSNYYISDGNETIYTATKNVFNGNEKMKFFGVRFMAIWVFPMAVTGTVMEFLFVSPLKGVNPFG